jgi:hypothetical protein
MYKILKADKDTYITNRVIDNKEKTKGNVGLAATLDLFKIYGHNYSGSSAVTELSRLLLHFDIKSIKELFSKNKVDIKNSTFFAKIKLFDVYGGQTTPENFTIDVYPLSASFEEGHGSEVVLYSDLDVANFLSSSITSPWILSGCMSAGGIAGSCDYITSSNEASFLSSQDFSIGNEDLEIDVTSILSATIAGVIPDAGFRITYTPNQEQDTNTYFVKRFAARQAFNLNKHPQLVVGFDDSIQDNSQNFTLDNTGSLFLYNSVYSTLTNLVSGSTAITGLNSLLLRLETEISGGFYSLYFTGSQHIIGDASYTGVYSASFAISSEDAVIKNKLTQSGSVKFKPIWSSFDQTVSYFTGSNLTFLPTTANNTLQNFLTVNVTNVPVSVKRSELVNCRVNIFDKNSPLIVSKRLPIILPGIVIANAYYCVRDITDGSIRIPFDQVNGSTRLSSDPKGMFFKLDASNLIANKTYTIDILLNSSGEEVIYKSVSGNFKITE